MAAFTKDQWDLLEKWFHAEHAYTRTLMEGCAFSVRRLQDVAAQVAAVTALLVQKGVITWEEVEATKREFEAEVAMNIAFPPEERQRGEDDVTRHSKEEG